MTVRTYTLPQSFKQALEQRLRTAAADERGARAEATAVGL
jgi:hypothetical protein